MLEMYYGWRGIGIDLEPFNGYYYTEKSLETIHGVDKQKQAKKILDDLSLQTWKTRKNTKVYEEDAINFDYSKAFKDNNFPAVIDYLSVDLEPPDATLECLLNIPFDEYKFRCITFETDEYREGGESRVLKSREYLTSKGYRMVKQVEYIDEYYVYDGEL